MPRSKFIRRLQGTGSVYKRTDGDRRRKPWVATITLGLKYGGKRHRILIGSYETKRDALDALDAYRLRGESGIPSVDVTVGQIWEHAKKERERMGNPINRNYLSTWNNHVSSLKDMPISAVKAMHLQNVVDDSGLKGSTQQRFVTVFHIIYDYAMANDLVTKDYSKYVKYATIETSTLHKPFTTAEMRTLWQHTDLDIVKVVLIQCYTGLRPTELATIEMDNVHLDEKYMIGGMKTAAGRNRTIPLADCIIPFVEYFYRISIFRNFKYLIMPDRNRGISTVSGHANMYFIYKSLTQLGIENHRAHDARHTFVTLCDNYGIDDTIQKRIVGHSFKRDITKGVYTHKVLPQLLAAVNSLPYGSEMTMTPEEKQDENGSLVVV